VTWTVERSSGRAAAFHGREVPEPPSPAVWVLEVASPALVLGSSQGFEVVRVDVVDERGVEVVRRRSGGGAVLLVPGDAVWIDVIVPRTDPRWVDDVGRSGWWLGRVWAEALAACGIDGAEVHEGRLMTTAWSSLVCFAGLGPGEVTVGGRKAVGVSQRRSRSAARFQCAVYRQWDPAALVELLADPRPSVDEIEDVVATVDVPADRLVAAFLAALRAD
jgi:lipoate-protein ligase A